MVEFPSGTVTFLFTDIEGSTQLWERHPKVMQSALVRHDSLIQVPIEEHGGLVVKSTGDGFHAVFSYPDQGLQAAIDAQRRLHNEEWDPAIGRVRVRMGLHTGTAELRGGDYYGRAVNRAARLCAAAHGGQIVLSSASQTLVAGDLPSEFLLTDMGHHQLKGLIGQERIYQLSAPDLPTEFPPLQTMDATHHNLPAQATPFLGREHHRAAMAALLQRDDVRLVTLSGPGGMGKTRLSLAVAEELLAAFADGVKFVELASIDDPALVIPAIAAILNIRSSTRTPTEEALARYLRNRQMLLVLDNFEQVVDAGSQVAELLAAAPGLKILVTSREILRIYGEHEYPLPPLELPSETRDMTAAVLAQNEAVALFQKRARAAQPTFYLTEENITTVVAICRRLDGLPLAIELVAAHVRMLTPDVLLRRLEQRLPMLTGGPRDSPVRQRTIRGAIDWSYNLLDQAERDLFAQLSVFVGGWTLSAAEAVCGAGASDEVLDGLVSLRDKSLLQQIIGASGDTRFSMLETIREYASERLRLSDERDDILSRHIAYYAAFAATDNEESFHFLGGESDIARFFEEYDNMRAAMRRALESGDWQSLLQIGANRGFLWDYVPLDARLEGMTWLEAAIATYDGNDPLLRARALLRLVQIMAVVPGRRRGEQARAYIEESLAISREAGEPDQILPVLNEMAELLWDIGQYVEAQAYLKEALTLAKQVENTYFEAITTGLQGILLEDLGEDDKAEGLIRQAIAFWTKLGLDGHRAVLETALAQLEMRRGNYDLAREMNDEATRAIQQYGRVHYATWGFNTSAEIALRQGDFDGVRAPLLESLSILKEYPDDEAMLDALEQAAGLQLAQNRWEEATMLLGTVTALREEVARPMHPEAWADHISRMVNLRDNLNETDFNEAWKRGEDLSWEEAIELVFNLLEVV